mgnify:CR=1 FL=1
MLNECACLVMDTSKDKEKKEGTNNLRKGDFELGNDEQCPNKNMIS